MKINFLDFWGGFDIHNNFFIHLFRDIYGSVEIGQLTECDYIIYSCFGQQHKTINRNKVKKIFYTGENIRPNFEDCDYSFTFDFDSYNGKNIRIPLYHLYIDWFNVSTYTNPKYLIHPSKINDNEFIKTPKTKFCATVFSSPRQIRFDLMNTLSTYKKVDGYGRPFGNHTEGELDKYQKLSNYKFSICPENSYYDGYYTEKLLHAKTAGTIPIYLADNKVHIDFNKKSFIDIADFSSLESLKQFVIKVDNNDELYQEIANQPLAINNFSLQSIKQQIKKILI